MNYLVRLGTHAVRRADPLNILVTQIRTNKKTGKEYESSASASWTSTLRSAP